jgi:hypothetical protein
MEKCLLSLLTLFIMVLNSCVKKETSKVKFGLLEQVTLKASVLAELLKHNKLEVCVTFPDIESAEDAEKLFVQEVKGNIINSIQRWNVLIASSPRWPHKSAANMEIVRKEKCDILAKGVKFFVWTQQNRYEKETKRCQDILKKGNRKTCPSSTNPSRKVVNISANSRRFNATYMHEFGHLLGLADTYVEAGRQEDLGDQPQSIMNKEYVLDGETQSGNSARFSRDDEAAAHLILELILDGPSECPEGYEIIHPDLGSRKNRLYCLPNEKAQKFLIDVKSAPLWTAFDQDSEEACEVPTGTVLKIKSHKKRWLEVEVPQGCLSDQNSLWTLASYGFYFPNEKASPTLLQGFTPCPKDFERVPVGNRGASFCKRGTEALAIVTTKMQTECNKQGFKFCSQPLWPVETFLSLRSRSFCATGSLIDFKSGYCIEEKQAHGPFPRKLIELCKARSQNPDLECQTLRMQRTLFNAVIAEWFEKYERK